MEIYIFETMLIHEEKIHQLETTLKNIPNIVNIKIKRLSNGLILKLEALNIQAFEIALQLKQNGFAVERLYEE
ncbi:hypothetical protein SF1_38580 [Sphingobacterium faecium NBRC 15299]|jgi:hypothetical protein|uniref:hypothetical protein n=1 Tax=Sphingobacterium faecium TaxID=34087 RepID=UPI000D3A67AD|nr:hypothetical protein [Sphingobacterium faecium]PTX13448.1 hypothetical protein C8N37_101185 [Sphingobacterium faecium]GEM65876.1 hypothetical protein SF1_38580 [Sphingobacterium faecium NBRC 15299]